MGCGTFYGYSVPILLFLLVPFITPLKNFKDCRVHTCYPCFSTSVTCNSRNKMEILPQYLNESLVKLALKFKSPDSRCVQFRKQDILRYGHLQSLTISGDFCSIEGEAMSVLPHLRLLSIRETSLSQLPDNLLASNGDLIQLTLYDNQFAEIPVRIFEYSREIPVKIYVFSKQGEVFLPCVNGTMRMPSEFDHYTRLSRLDLSYNSFYSFNCSVIADNFFQPLQNLSTLEISGTNLIHSNERSLRGLSKLQTLEISSLSPYKFCPATIESLLLNLPENIINLRIVHWEVHAKLEKQCVITNTSLVGLRRLKHLQKLSFSFGDGLFGAVLKRSIMPKIPTLRKLDLSSCRINVIEENTFAGYERLVELNLAGNPLGPKDLNLLPQTTANIHILTLDDTSIRSNDFYRYQVSHLHCNFPNLRKIKFSSNHLEHLPEFLPNVSSCNATTHPSLTQFTATDNVIKAFAEVGNNNGNICSVFPNLERLVLSNNKLQDLSGLELCVNLTLLQLDQNRLSYFDHTLMASIFCQLNKMVNVNLGFNEINDLDDQVFMQMADLQEIHMNDNNLERIGRNLFRKNTKLVSIILERNKIQHLEPTTFDGLTQLKNLDLGDNKLAYLLPHMLDTIDALPLKFFGVESNPFDCDCDKVYFQKWLLDNAEFEQRSMAYIVCSSPENQRGKYVYEYEADIYNCTIKQVLIVGGSIIAVFMVTLAIAVPCYKYRWYISHFRIVFQALTNSLETVKKEHKCRYAGYVSFDTSCQEDFNWVGNELIPGVEGPANYPHLAEASNEEAQTQESLRLYVEPRDANVGGRRFTQRDKALDDSKRILIVLSNSYLRSRECLSEADLAGVLMNGSEFYQPNRILVLIREELSEEIIRAPISSLLQGKTLKVERDENKKRQMWKAIRKFLAKPLYLYCKPEKIKVSQNRSETRSGAAAHNEDDIPLLIELV